MRQGHVSFDVVALKSCVCWSAVALERTAWQQPVSAGAISERGKLQVRLGGYHHIASSH